jgi:hypothetical protein
MTARRTRRSRKARREAIKISLLVIIISYSWHLATITEMGRKWIETVK